MLAFGVRLAYVENTSYHSINDAGSYNRLASMVARTGDYDTGSGPRTGAGNSRGPTAYFPPGYPYFMAVVDLLTGHEAGHKQAIEPVRVAQTVLGTVAVGLIGLVAFEALGWGPAVAALALAAIYPVLVELTGTLVAENLLVVFELAACWTALRARRSRHPYVWIAATGVLAGLAALTHENAILLLVPLGFGAAAATRRFSRTRDAPAASRARAIGARLRALGRRSLAPALLVVVALLTIVPWTVRNANELHTFIPISDETGITLIGTYNPSSATLEPVPYKWQYFRAIPQEQDIAGVASRYTEPQLDSILEQRALNYISAHPLAPAEVAFHNTLRMFELEGTYAWQASAIAIGLHTSDAQVGVISFWVLCLFALAGAFTAPVRAAPRWLWGVPLLYGLSVVLVNVETPRFREPIDPFIVLLAASAISTGVGRLRSVSRRGVSSRSR